MTSTTARKAALRVALIVGARPNLVKAAALLGAFREEPRIACRFIHTGQHYDDRLSGIFFRELGLPQPDVSLGVGSGTHAWQTGTIMTRLEEIMIAERPDRVLVVGDVNSTVAAALVAAKLCIPVDHVEAGLRSGDRTMPEEINRLVTDSVASLLFASEPAGVENLVREGHARDSIHHVGNVMIDSLERMRPHAVQRAAWLDHGVEPGHYALVTLHRPSNVDDPERFGTLLDGLAKVSDRLPLLFPVHPRTRPALQACGPVSGLRLLDPLGYVDFLSLLMRCRFVLTDSGGIQEESTALGVPCLTLRDSTERPITVTTGTNTLVGQSMPLVLEKVTEILDGRYRRGDRPQFWDGRAAHRVAAVLTS